MVVHMLSFVLVFGFMALMYPVLVLASSFELGKLEAAERKDFFFQLAWMDTVLGFAIAMHLPVFLPFVENFLLAF